ncbi:hypothetical protein PTTG_06456 [Puccinia triticina 1-1 BBBD Race 1]|uniref:Uncharacterized protein n=1 Tax=Puccinia triticina (isolate 1-1 / race 1 (BBBD)) TaxID=630390 RepID=A0A180GX11_PUCT1|nr:hypothetical protein PTTG_06456 [Puccinia triticina 1-1 BBBD Race 1]
MEIFNDDADLLAVKEPATQNESEKSKWDVGDNQPKNAEKQHDSNRVNHSNPRGSSRGQSKGARGRGTNLPRGARGRRQRGSADDDRSFPADKTGTSTDGVKEQEVKEKSLHELSKENGESASSVSEGSEDDDEEDDEEVEDEDDEDYDDEDDEHEVQSNDEAGEDPTNDKAKGPDNLNENAVVNDIQSEDPSPIKPAELSPKGPPKKQPYVRQVDLPKEKLSPADLEAKMAAMALKNARLIEQKKAADQDAAEYREIELKSQRNFEAQRAQQQEIDAARKAAADRKLKKTQGREWDWEKTEDDWNRSRPYTDSMTNPNPGKHSWNNHRGSGFRGRPARGAHPRGRGAGRGGRGGARGAEGSESQKVDQPSVHDNQTGPAQGQSNPNGTQVTPST